MASYGSGLSRIKERSMASFQRISKQIAEEAAMELPSNRVT
jgi:hypothetical protein